MADDRLQAIGQFGTRTAGVGDRIQEFREEGVNCFNVRADKAFETQILTLNGGRNWGKHLNKKELEKGERINFRFFKSWQLYLSVSPVGKEVSVKVWAGSWWPPIIVSTISRFTGLAESQSKAFLHLNANCLGILHVI